MLVTAAPGVPVDAARSAAAAPARPFGATDVLDREAYVAERTGFVGRLLSLVYVMLALAIVIALMGIGSTLSLAVHERTAELGLLRAVGQTRAQVRAMVRWESALIALFGAAAGAALGLMLAWTLAGAMGTAAAPTVLSVPGGRLAAVIAVAAGAGVVAAVRPARRAAALDVLAAIGRS